MELKTGDKAPAFAMQDASGKTYRLSDYSGKTVILYFYPKDDTPGCTKEACSFRDGREAIAKKGAVVLGVSPDDAASHVKFSAKYSLNFPILSDEGHKAASAYGAWGKKKFMGREYEGIIRSTFIIDGKGKIKQALYDVKPEGHADEILGML
jgi:peroxiredoxin Q/BCP